MRISDPDFTRMQLSKTNDGIQAGRWIHAAHARARSAHPTAWNEVELIGVEPTASALQGRRSPN
jgi:hypothetical protein